MHQASDTRCRRCGTCCEKGGPALHLEDRERVEAGVIPADCLFTLRRGEMVRDNVTGVLAPLDREIIKIKGQHGRWTCRFYEREQHGCAIYSHRPVECQALNCRDTRQIEAMYATRRLIRKDLLDNVEGLWDLIVDHETRCAYERVGDLVGRGVDPATGQLQAQSQILEMMGYDTHLRKLVVDTGGMDAGMLDFIFGRPLSETIAMHHIRLEKTAHGYRLCPTGTVGDTGLGP
jgi:Fe-S-cluster containining protein